jgi:hypothetical protein
MHRIEKYVLPFLQAAAHLGLLSPARAIASSPTRRRRLPPDSLRSTEENHESELNQAQNPTEPRTRLEYPLNSAGISSNHSSEQTDELRRNPPHPSCYVWTSYSAKCHLLKSPTETTTQTSTIDVSVVFYYVFSFFIVLFGVHISATNT